MSVVLGINELCRDAEFVASLAHTALEYVSHPQLAAEEIHQTVRTISAAHRPGYLEIHRDLVDVVIPVPDTSRTAAVQVAHELGVKYREGFIKNRYIGRTFIMPGQAERKASVRRKLNAIELEFRDKNVLLVDDSIVRGTTSQQIIDLARAAGANKVYFASAAPPVRYPNVYGIDMPAAHELVANGRTVEEIQEIIGADWLVYQDLDALIAAVHHENAEIESFDTSCFSGEYVTGDVSQTYLDELEAERSDSAKLKRDERVIREENDDEGDEDSMQVASVL